MSSQQRLLSTDSTLEESAEFVGRPSWASPQAEDGEERTYSRRRSLECTSVEIRIVETELTQDHIMYVIEASSGIKKWTVYRRFRDFYFLDKQLRKCFPKIKIPSLPPKRFFGSSTDREFVDSRKEQLESYLTTLVGIQSIWTRNELALFLNNDANSMMFIWNFERMRRMQDMLSSMKIENQTETAKLTSDLVEARDQVTALQSRLSRMEMLFLQQATGVAGEQLPSSVLRTLSGINNTLSHQLVNELTEEHVALYDSAHPVVGEGGSVSLAEEQILRQNILEDAIQAHVASGDTISADEVVKVLNLTRDDTLGQVSDLNSRTRDDVRTVAMSLQLQEALRISNEIFDEKFDISTTAPAKSINSHASEADISRMLTPRTNTMAVSISRAEQDLYDFQAPTSSSEAWTAQLLNHVDGLVSVLSPNLESLAVRHRVFQYVRTIVSSTLGVQLFPTGSFVSHTFLPDGDIDATAFVLKNDDDSWFVKVNEALCMSAFNQGSAASKSGSFDTYPETDSDRHAVTINNVSFVNGEIKMIKSMIDDVSVDISVNQIGALYSQAFIEQVDQFVGQNHLFKRSVLLVKAWCQYESPRHTHGSGSLAGSKEGRITAWATVVMLTWVFNSEGRSIAHPLQALGHFLRIFSNFDWDLHALTVRGPVSAADLSPLSDTQVSGLFFPEEVLDALAARSEDTRRMSCSPMEDHRAERENKEGLALGSASSDSFSVAPTSLKHGVSSWVMRSAFPQSEGEYQQGLINIMDPTAPTHSLSKSVDAQGYDAITNALLEGYKHFQSLCDSFSKLGAKIAASSPADARNDEIVKATRIFLLHTSNRATSLTQSVSRNAKATVGDWLAAQTEELDFSLHYAELVLGGKVHQEALIQLIIQILVQKGQMPVGEIGKNLQLLTGCDTLSKRLKDQFSGLKKAIELSNCPRLRVGTEHPFNPIVALVDCDSSADTTQSAPLPSFAHVSFVFTPLQAMASLTSSNIKEAAAQHAKSSAAKTSYRRQPPYYLDNTHKPGSFDTMSVISQSTRGTSHSSAMGEHGYLFKKSHFNSSRAKPQSPGGRYGSNNSYRGGNSVSNIQQQQQQQLLQLQQQQQAQQVQPIQHQVVDVNGNPMMYAQSLDGSGSYIPVPVMGGAPQQQGQGQQGQTGYGSVPASAQAMNLYQQQMHLAYLQQQQMYQNYAASMASSLGSSYGQSVSPGGNLSYMHIAEQQNMLLQQQQQHALQVMQQQAALQQQQQQHSSQQPDDA